MELLPAVLTGTIVKEEDVRQSVDWVKIVVPRDSCQYTRVSSLPRWPVAVTRLGSDSLRVTINTETHDITSAFSPWYDVFLSYMQRDSRSGCDFRGSQFGLAINSNLGSCRRLAGLPIVSRTIPGQLTNAGRARASPGWSTRDPLGNTMADLKLN